ncbi:hypothetical protein AWZ03_004691 [Drosophila navojoa]|uniref:Lipocalin/cytosolic fatty-acid binding domain-containing protein n=1 Tax=Drosophila navojoa TaxID=7232 RepID=A0A484BJ70_DRONA|nr:uncharacterized protein LOC108660237 [Drosophila navojoa]TDG48788.1 hypothetical protein AWZ03_004691 [Drosophila navojoa]
MMWKVVIVLVAALALASAQNQVTGPQTCSAAGVQSLDWNNTALFGRWLEVARNPLGDAPACLEFNVGLLWDNTTLSINASHSSSSESLYSNIDESAKVTLTPQATTGYNVTFYQNNAAQPPVFIKLLQLINNTYVTGCGYTDPNNANTSYGFILAMAGMYNAEGIKLVNDQAFPLYSNFQNNSYANITQAGCFKSSATQSLPMISGILAVALLLIRAY